MSQLSNLSTPLKPSIELIDHPLQLTSSAWPLPLSMSIQLNNYLFHFPSSPDPSSPSAPTTVTFLYSFLHQNTWKSSQFSPSPIPSPLILPPIYSIQDLSQVTTETSSTLLSPAVDSQSYPLGDQVPLGPEEVEPSPRSQQVLGLPDLPTHVSVHPARAVWFLIILEVTRQGLCFWLPTGLRVWRPSLVYSHVILPPAKPAQWRGDFSCKHFREAQPHLRLLLQLRW